MTLVKQGRLLFILTAAVLLLAITVISFSVIRVHAEAENIAMAERIIRGATSFRFLIMERVFYRESRSEVQWRRRIASFREMLNQQRFYGPVENNLLAKERANLDVVARLYEGLAHPAGAPNALSGDAAAENERIAATVSAIFLATQDMLDDAFELQRLKRASLAEAQDQAGLLMLLSILALTVLIAAGALIIRRRVLAPIAELQMGTERVAKGDLEFRLGLTVANEIGVLAHTFDDMTAQLMQSRNALLAEIAERQSAQSQLHATVEMLEQAQAAQQHALAQLKGMVDAATDFSIISTDVEGTIKLFSSGAERMLGYTAAEVVDKASPTIIHLADEMLARSRVLSEELGRTIEGFDVFVALPSQGKSESREWTYVRKDGTTLPVNLTVTSVRDNHGNITGFLGIAKDIREEKNTLWALAHARDQAEAASISKGEFVANMSHEIRTPMNAILGMLQLLQHTDLTMRQLDYATKAQAAARSLLGLLNDVLDFSKVEAGKLVMEQAPFQFDRFLTDLAVILSVNVGDKDVEVLFSIDPKLPAAVQGDVLRLQQILLNLAGNAIKFTQHGEVVVSLRVVAQDRHSTEIHFSVRDTGIGMAPESLAHIFEGFSQAEASTSRRFGGTGLGLAISQRLTALMGGVLQVDSKPGVGSCFHFTLTFEHTDAADMPAVSVSSGDVEQKRHVLIVDDNESAREVMSSMVEALGWDADTAASGQEALRLLRRSADCDFLYDVVFVDWKMPEMDGWETARAIRNLPRGDRSPVVVMVTAHGREALSSRLDSEKNMLNGFLVKPITTSMLFDAVTDANSGEKEAALRVKAPLSGLRLAGLRLLLVEDTPMNQQVARELLASEGALVEIAEGGLTGVAMTLRDGPPFDVVLMHIHMPDMDGYAATRQIRQDGRMQALPIIAMTANVMPADKAACRDAGMNDHIAKPIDLEDLVRTIRHHCDLEFTGFIPVAPHDSVAQASESVIELDLALRRMNGDKVLFAKLARRFAADTATMIADLRHCFREEDWERAALFLHTLKGIAGTIGAAQLVTCVVNAENILCATGENINADEMLLELEHRLEKSKELLEAIARDFRIPDQFEGLAKAPDMPTLQAALDELDALLQGSNMQATLVFASLRQQFGSFLGDSLTPLAAAMDRLDFRSASSDCRVLRAANS